MDVGSRVDNAEDEKDDNNDVQFRDEFLTRDGRKSGRMNGQSGATTGDDVTAWAIKFDRRLGGCAVGGHAMATMTTVVREDDAFSMML
ncbi:hypothetical protein ACLOJK_010596 [Asimina triloba]